MKNIQTARGAFPDSVGFEAFANKFHIEDFLSDASDANLVMQAISAARRLSTRKDLSGCRIILSIMIDEPIATITFFLKRPGQIFATDNLDDFKAECLATYDVV